MPRQHEIPPEVLALPPQQQRLFESDFLRAAARDKRVAKMGRGYYSLGWVDHHNAVCAHGRRRRAPGECRISNCACSYHVAATAKVEVDAARAEAFGDFARKAFGETASNLCEHDFKPANGRELWCHKCGSSITKDAYSSLLLTKIADHQSDENLVGVESDG